MFIYIDFRLFMNILKGLSLYISRKMESKDK